MILVPKTYAEMLLGFDSIMLTTSLLFRKPKPKPVKSTLDRKSLRLRLLGYYLVGSAIVLLVLNHYVFYTNLLDYFAGLLIDGFIFYLGLRVVLHE